jgi:prepilin signal peptidase PulO-like enzyme (type II secretory pathway)
LLPLISFIIQGGKCRHCKTKLSLIHPTGELIMGLIFAFLPERIASFGLPSASLYSPEIILWMLVAITLYLLSFIDLRLHIVPDEGNLFLVILGALSTFVYPIKALGVKVFSFLGPYANLFGFQEGEWSNRLLATILSMAFFGFLILITKGRGMGVGDLKMSIGLGLLFGWPDVAVLIGLAFIFGAILGVYLIASKNTTLKTAVPFVPFLVLASFVIIFFGKELVTSYFNFIGPALM